ncbi:GNAT family N-acetyltransferase [Paenibacillus solanacearum]|uniref:GNAT family N-acetyltransferase n=1 Tax=Paenibacillus solanacearum TaxID=2048548 RepID=UPI0031BAD1F9
MGRGRSRSSSGRFRLRHPPQWNKRGYGREAMSKISEFIRTFPAGPARYCWIAYEPDNLVAKKLYESFGFRETGEVCHNEPVAVLQL